MTATILTWPRRMLVLTLTALTALTASAVAVSSDATAAGASACRTSQLRVWRADPGSGTTGSVYYELQFSNVSNSRCTLDGYPGVSAVAGNGRQLGSAAARDDRFAPAAVVLAPGATAHAVLRITDVSNYAPSTCQSTTATALKIYPPNTSTAAKLAFRFRACSKSGPAYLTVRTVRPGTGVPDYSQ
jgi:hypothetical protein